MTSPDGRARRRLTATEVDLEVLRQRALLVGTGVGTRQLSDAEASLAELALLADTAGADPVAIPLDAASALNLEVGYHGVTYHGDAAGVGNPHLVLFVDDVERARVTQHGRHLEHDPRFPNGTNVEFVASSGPDELQMRVWERGVGETLSCGTGACAAAAAAHQRGLVGTQVTVHVPGGDLSVDLGDTVRLGGPVRHVFDVEVDGGA